MKSLIAIVVTTLIICWFFGWIIGVVIYFVLYFGRGLIHALANQEEGVDTFSVDTFCVSVIFWPIMLLINCLFGDDSDEEEDEYPSANDGWSIGPDINKRQQAKQQGSLP